MRRLLITMAAAAAMVAGLQAAQAQEGSGDAGTEDWAYPSLYYPGPGYEDALNADIEGILSEIKAAQDRGDCGTANAIARRLWNDLSYTLDRYELDYWDQTYFKDRLYQLFGRPCPPPPVDSEPPFPPLPPEPVESVVNDLTPVVPIIGPGLGETASGVAEPADDSPTAGAGAVENIREEVQEGARRQAERRSKALRQKLKPDEQTLLDLHNRARSQVGVPPLQWDSRLAAQAASYGPALAQYGRPVHSPREGRETSRENLLQALPGTSAEKMIAVWTAERQHFVPGTFPDVSRTGNWADVGHYTQMVWPATTHVGCAIHRGGRFDWLICRYSPPGNQDGKPLLSTAPAAPRPR